ncbi:helix-turn-helix domain-containing protein [Methylobacterium sp. WL19]|uniref:helix-turn-helix domain-containing protein n=1 Tax=Methylobacterium sp. WL19 TaxID=2603896 RepID=UPI0011C84241|nr:helix-turn-helix domain-containing protein [Methylobacterium sp. WL19]TXN33929.1 hypothetical protein FV220_00330 [Methylobacterium sp. WL19]
MSTGAPLPVYKYASGDEMLQRYAAIRAATFAPRHVPVKPPTFVPQTIKPPDRAVTVKAEAEVRAAFLEATREERVETLKILRIARVVAAVTGITVEAIKGQSRKAPTVKARQIAMFIALKTGRPLTACGHALGERHHTTVIHARDKLSPIAERLGLAGCSDAVEIAHQLWNADWRLADGAAR